VSGSLIAEDARVLGIETSCDETAVAVVQGGTKILSNVIASQTKLHAPFGGVVPEIAARAHVERMPYVVDEALRGAGVHFRDIDAVAATRGPGLIGALLVGFATGKATASALGVPFIGVQHLDGHVFATRLQYQDVEPPLVALVVSGGHTSLLGVDEFGTYQVLGRTLDDAAGEAFDKIGRFLGLGFPGGPAIDRLSKRGDAASINFPRAMISEGLDFSFSGLKTAVVRHVMRAEKEGTKIAKADVAASFQEAVVDVQVTKAIRAAEERGVKTILMGGGVAANTRLRSRLEEESAKRGLRLVVPDRKLCVDNGAMIAAAGHFRLRRGESTPFDQAANASLPLPGTAR
jgi:N6-L-threonylcarbamoyladenine synthase